MISTYVFEAGAPSEDQPGQCYRARLSLKTKQTKEHGKLFLHTIVQLPPTSRRYLLPSLSRSPRLSGLARALLGFSVASLQHGLAVIGRKGERWMQDQSVLLSRIRPHRELCRPEDQAEH